MSAATHALTPDEVQDEVSRWLRADRFSIDWVTETGVVLSDLLDTSANAIATGVTRKALHQLIPTTTEYTLDITVGPTRDEPTWVRVKLTAGRRVIDQEVVDASWWAGLGLAEDDSVGRLRRGAAAIAVLLLSRRLHDTPVALHGIVDPRVLFLLNEVPRADDAGQRAIIRRASRLDPANRAVRYAMLGFKLRESRPNGERPSAHRLELIELALAQVEEDCKDDPMLRVRVAYSRGACGTNSTAPAARSRAHQTFVRLYNDELSTLPTPFATSVEPAICTALACACRQTGCSRQHELFALAIKHSADSRAMYNLACLYAVQPEPGAHHAGDHQPSVGASPPGGAPRFPSVVPGDPGALEVALDYLELAIDAAPELAEFARTDTSLAELDAPTLPALDEQARTAIHRRFRRITKVTKVTKVTKPDQLAPLQAHQDRSIDVPAGSTVDRSIDGAGFIGVAAAMDSDITVTVLDTTDPSKLQLEITPAGTDGSPAPPASAVPD